jgi:hypothetical protein
MNLILFELFDLIYFLLYGLCPYLRHNHDHLIQGLFSISCPLLEQ